MELTDAFDRELRSLIAAHQVALPEARYRRGDWVRFRALSGGPSGRDGVVVHFLRWETRPGHGHVGHYQVLTGNGTDTWVVDTAEHLMEPA